MASGIVTEEVRRMFSRLDANKDGKISKAELEQLMKSLGTRTTEAELKMMMEEMDKDGDGYVDIKEFAEFHAGTGGNAGTTEELRETFNMFDKDGNGLISARELHGVLKSLGEKCSLKDCTKMIQSVDVDGDGFVDFNEFKRMMGDADPEPDPNANPPAAAAFTN